MSGAWRAADVARARVQRRRMVIGVVLLIAAICLWLNRYGIALVVGIELLLIGGWLFWRPRYVRARRPASAGPFRYLAEADVRPHEAATFFGVPVRRGSEVDGFVGLRSGEVCFYPLRRAADEVWSVAAGDVAGWHVDSARKLAFVHLRRVDGHRLTVRTRARPSLEAVVRECLQVG